MTETKKGVLSYVTGDATEPEGDGMKEILHSCNNAGGWGAGFVLALDQKWTYPGDVYYEWSKNLDGDKGIYKDVPFELGYVMMVPVTEDITVANIIGQGTPRSKKYQKFDKAAPIGPAVSYEALKTAFKSIVLYNKETPGYEDVTIHMPRIGAVLGGGDWKVIEGIIKEYLCDAGFDVTVYDLPANSTSAGRVGTYKNTAYQPYKGYGDYSKGTNYNKKQTHQNQQQQKYKPAINEQASFKGFDKIWNDPNKGGK